ncbi:hypothetical protein FQN55_005494 [Onygenales sp. PD_40]|nr:hypothetical protein FQN55_005494 [Onygenales sp. PD_40]
MRFRLSQVLKGKKGRDVPQKETLQPDTHTEPGKASFDTSVEPEPPEKNGLLFLNESQFQSATESGQARHSVDIIAVHGLNGHPYETWRHENGNVWLRDFLPLQYPGARIFSFGYSSEVAFTLSTGKLPDFARSLLENVMAVRKTSEEMMRPIIFVCHSMGGIVVKKALSIAIIDSEDYDNIRTSTCGILFFSTPHRGSTITRLPEVMVNIANLCLAGTSKLTGRMRSDLIKSLERDSQDLKSISTDIRHQIAAYRIVSFVEKKSTPPFSHPVVDDFSGIMDLPKETIVPMDGRDHRDVCRFGSTKESLYSVVCRHLDKLAGDIHKLPSTEEGKECLKSLSFPSLTSRFHSVTGVEGDTCSWIFSQPPYERWITDTNKAKEENIFWIKGKPGSGKSTLMKYLVQSQNQTASKLRGNRPLPLVTASFFFSARGNDLDKSAVGLFRSLLHQILQEIPSMLQAFLPLYRKKRDTQQPGWKWHLDELQKFFASALATGPNCRIMLYIDALDECQEQDVRNTAQFVEKIATQTSSSGTEVRICLSSRHYPNIVIKGCQEIRMEEHNLADISAYVHTKMEAVGYRGENLTEKIISKASGVFLWVVLVMERFLTAIEDGETDGNLLRELDSIPDNLKDLYANIIGSIPQSERPHAVEIVFWILLAKRPLTATEVRYALAFSTPFRSQKQGQKSQNFIQSDDSLQKIVRKWTRGLIEVTRMEDDSKPVVQFIHESIREFLSQKDNIYLFNDSLGPNPLATGHHRLFSSCLNYIKIIDLSRQPQNGEEYQRHDISTAIQMTSDLSNAFPLLQYSVLNMFTHAANADKGGKATDLLDHFPVAWEGLSAIWLWRFNLIRQSAWETMIPQKATLLHMASIFGLSSFAKAMIDKGVEVNGKDASGHIALHIAASHGHGDVVKCLLESGADIEAKNGRGHAALHQAAARGQTAVVDLLIEYGTNLMAVNNNGHTAVHYAAAEGRADIVELLAVRGVELNVQNSLGESPLHQAAARGHDEAVEYLLSYHANPNIVDNNNETPIYQAAASGHFEVVSILLEYGADYTITNSRGETALYQAEINKDKAIMEILIAHGADARIQDTKEEALQYQEMVKGYKAFVDRLVPDGDDISIRPSGGALALHQAAADGKQIAIMELIRHGALVDETDADGRTALHMAASECHEKAVEMLIRHGANVNQKDGRGYVPLVYAIARGGDAAIKTLIRHGASIDVNQGP